MKTIQKEVIVYKTKVKFISKKTTNNNTTQYKVEYKL